MLSAVRLYARYAGVSVRSQMQYRASFVMQTLGHLLVTGIEFLAIWALFDRFGSIRGWRLPEVALFYGMVSVSWALTDATSRGFDAFANMVKGGDFDRLLLRPRTTVLQLAGQELTLRRVGRLAQAGVVLGWATCALDIQWTAARVGLLAWAILGGACLFYGILVLQATLAFWTIESLEAMNILTYGGVETAQFPLTIYRPWLQKFFTYVVPLACANYFPAHAILGRAEPLGSPAWFQCTSPAVGVLFLAVALQVWKVGVRHYRSTGS